MWAKSPAKTTSKPGSAEALAPADRVERRPEDGPRCSGNSGDILTLNCSGGSNVGQRANRAAVELTREGVGKIYGLAAVGAHVEKFVGTARRSAQEVNIDGCQMACTQKPRQHLQTPSAYHLVVTDPGAAKTRISACIAIRSQKPNPPCAGSATQETCGSQTGCRGV